jgi:hypothetical protein
LHNRHNLVLALQTPTESIRPTSQVGNIQAKSPTGSAIVACRKTSGSATTTSMDEHLDQPPSPRQIPSSLLLINKRSTARLAVAVAALVLLTFSSKLPSPSSPRRSSGGARLTLARAPAHQLHVAVAFVAVAAVLMMVARVFLRAN